VRVRAFEVGKDDIAVQRVSVLGTCVFDHGVCHSALVIADELAAASRTHLFERHVHIIARCRAGGANTDRQSCR